MADGSLAYLSCQALRFQSDIWKRFVVNEEIDCRVSQWQCTDMVAQLGVYVNV